MINIAIVLILAVVTNSLHLNHQQVTQPYNSTNYLSELSKIQARFRNDIQNIKEQINQINNVLNSSTLPANQQLTTLAEGMADERDSLYNIQTYLNNPSNIQACKQINLTNEQRAQLQNKITVARQSLTKLKGEANFCLQCPQIQEIQLELKKNFNYLDVLEATVHSTCLKKPYQFQDQNSTGLVDIANNLYKDNLKAPNWVYGNTTEKDYRVYLFKLSSQYNLTSCPIQYPFVDSTNKRCYFCDGVYNIGQRKCIPCPATQHFNLTTLKCEDNPKQCPKGTKLNSSSNECVPILCAEELKLDLQTNLCVSKCTQDQFYNFTSKVCQLTPIKCLDGQFYNTASKKCQLIICSQGQKYNTTLKKCVDEKQNTVSVCPPERPYWNSELIRCEACPSASPLYNKQYNRCEKCPTGQQYKTQSKKCQNKCRIDQNYNQSTDSCENKCFQYQYYNQTSSKCMNRCPEEKNYNTTTKLCVDKCIQGQKYNYTTRRCVSVCKTHQRYNISSKSCEIYCKQSEAYNFEEKDCEVACKEYEFYNRSSKICQSYCPFGDLVYNFQSKNCEPCLPNQIFNLTTKYCDEKCPSPQLYDALAAAGVCKNACEINQNYNLSTRTCQAICSKSEKYNQTIKSCQPICQQDQNYNQTSKTCSSKCKQNFSWSQTEKKCFCGPNYFLSASDCLIKPVCSYPTPVYNGTINKCQQCPNITPNYQNKACKACPVDRPNYSPKLSQCLPACPSGYSWNSTYFQCDLKKCQNLTKPYLNLVSSNCEQCPKGTVWFVEDKLCKASDQCPIAKPYYNTISLKCQSCPNSTPVYNIIKRVCQACKNGFIYNVGLGECIEQENCKNNPALCPKCLEGQKFNIQLNKCQRLCSSTEFYNSQTKRCEKCQSSEIFSQQVGKCVKNICPEGSYLDKTNICVTCPLGSFYSSSLQSCIKCPSDAYFFDETTQKCLQCQPLQKYNSKTNKCQLVQCQNGFYFSLKDNSCKVKQQCLPGQFFDLFKQVCKGCQPNQYWNADKNRCEIRPNCQSDQQFSIQKKQCIKVEHITSKNAQNLVYLYNFTTYIQKYNSRVQQSKNVKDCPGDFPYYDEIKKVCVRCPTDKPYFNLHSNYCQNCGNGKYDSQKRQCINNQVQVSPTLERLIMNII